MLIYFGLPSVGLSPSGFVSTWLSLAFVLMAFSEEIFWAGITSVAKGQWEAARSTGLSFGQTLMNVVLPQALRLTIPPLTNRTIAITKGTALGTVVAVTEILGQASSAMSNSYNPSPLMMGAAAYLVLFLPVVVVGRWVETRFAWQRLMEAMIQTFFNPEIIAGVPDRAGGPEHRAAVADRGAARPVRRPDPGAARCACVPWCAGR